MVKKYRNNITGEIVTIIDTYQNIAITDNKEKIAVSHLNDSKYFTEEIDPVDFLNSPSTYNLFTETIKNVDTSNLPPDMDDVVVYPEGFKPATNESAVIYSDPDLELQELLSKYPNATIDQNALAKQNQAFEKLLNPEKTQRVQTQSTVVDQVNSNLTTNLAPNHDILNDPIINMFRNVKRNIDFDINIPITKRIPRLDFIEMMEDSYEISLIDFLADEFIKDILIESSSLRDKIAKEIRKMVYGGEYEEQPDDINDTYESVLIMEEEKDVFSNSDAIDDLPVINKQLTIPFDDF